MEFNEYKERLSARLLSSFDLEEDVMIGAVPVALKASFKRVTERYVLVKKNVQYRYETNEYFYLLQQMAPTVAQLEQTVQQLTDAIIANSQVDREHMSSDHTIIFHVDIISPEVADFVRKFIYRRFFKLGFQGWAHIGLVMVDTTGQIIYSRHRRQKPYRFLDMKSK